MTLKIKHVTKSFKNRTAVRDFSMDVAPGDCIGLIGPNGAGKSTLFQIIADTIKPTKGSVTLDGQQISKKKQHIGYLPQYPSFEPWMTAQETLVFLGGLSGLSEAKLNTSIPDILKTVGLDGEDSTKVGTFSGGMKQRLGIAQTLLHEPSLILMDEPVSSLDPIGRREILNLIDSMKQHATLLLSTHILADVEEVCERMVMIKNGMKIQDTTIKDLYRENSQNKIKIEMSEVNQYWIDRIQHLDYVKDIQRTGRKITVTLKDYTNYKNMLLQDALDHDVDLTKFEVSGETLEEIFFKWVVST